MTDWTGPTNPMTTLNIREIRTEISGLRDSLRRVIRDGQPTDAQRDAIEEAVRLLGEVRNVLAPAGVDR